MLPLDLWRLLINFLLSKRDAVVGQRLFVGMTRAGRGRRRARGDVIVLLSEFPSSRACNNGDGVLLCMGSDSDETPYNRYHDR